MKGGRRRKAQVNWRELWWSLLGELGYWKVSEGGAAAHSRQVLAVQAQRRKAGGGWRGGQGAAFHLPNHHCQYQDAALRLESLESESLWSQEEQGTFLR